jgi:hypothetical protein
MYKRLTECKKPVSRLVVGEEGTNLAIAGDRGMAGHGAGEESSRVVVLEYLCSGCRVDERRG